MTIGTSFPERRRRTWRARRSRPGTCRARGDDGGGGEGRGGAQDGADIVRIGDLIEHQHDAGGGQILDAGRGQRIGLGDQGP